MFILKKIIGSALRPIPFCLEIAVIGFILLWFTKKQRTGKILVVTGFVLFIGFSYGPLPEALIEPLEYKYPPLISIPDANEIKWVVVLGGRNDNPKLTTRDNRKLTTPEKV